MDRRQLLRSSLLLAGGTLIHQFSSANQTNVETAGIIDNGVSPFRINFSRERIKDLQRRLDNTLWPEMPFDTDWSSGTNDKVLKDLVKYWRSDYNWFSEQEKLNQLPHFKVRIAGDDVHFVHYKASGKRQPYPLLLLHGWPSSFLEFAGVAPVLTNGTSGQAGFDLVVPSLPGFVFSDAPKQAGIHYAHIGERMHQLMKSLGYEQYGVIGGDWGFVVGKEVARLHPEAVVKLLLDGSEVSDELPKKGATEQEQRFIEQWSEFLQSGTGYAQIQATKPQTLAYALQDSPVGLLSWILEKYHAWTDHSADLWQKLDRNYVLNTVVLYWLTGKVLSASRYYFEHSIRTKTNKDKEPVQVPTKWMAFAKNPWTAPDALTDKSDYTNFTGYTIYEQGGHFPAIEVPELWMKEVITFFSKS